MRGVNFLGVNFMVMGNDDKIVTEVTVQRSGRGNQIRVCVPGKGGGGGL